MNINIRELSKEEAEPVLVKSGLGVALAAMDTAALRIIAVHSDTISYIGVRDDLDETDVYELTNGSEQERVAFYRGWIERLRQEHGGEVSPKLKIFIAVG